MRHGIPAISYTSDVSPRSATVNALDRKFESYRLAPGLVGRKGSNPYARRTSHFEAGLSLVPDASKAGNALAGIEDQDQEGEGVVHPAQGERWNLAPLTDDHVDLYACESTYDQPLVS